MTDTQPQAELVALEPCPFPHEVKRGVFLEIDMEDFGFARGACSDCGCAGPFVTLDSCEKVTKAERAEATRLWNTRTLQPSPASIGPNRLPELRHWFFQKLNPEQRMGFLFAAGVAPRTCDFTLGMQHKAIEIIAERLSPPTQDAGR